MSSRRRIGLPVHEGKGRPVVKAHLAVGAQLTQGDIADLCQRAEHLLADGEVDALLCDVGAVPCPDATTIDALARLRLEAQRMGRSIRLRGASGELRDLITLVGLADVLGTNGTASR